MTFEDFLESKGFQADACQSCIEPDFYRLASEMHETLEKIANTPNKSWWSIQAELMLRPIA